MTIKECSDYAKILKITASKPLGATEYAKITLRRVQIRREDCFQAEKFTKTQVFHENIPCAKLSDWLEANAAFKFGQICVVMDGQDVTYMFSKDGRVTRMQRTTASKTVKAQTNNRSKNYILNEGDNVPIQRDGEHIPSEVVI